VADPVAGLTGTPEYDPPVQKYVISELDSGQRVITERLTHVRSVALGYWIGAGSRDERDERAGVSHFIEHLLFKGSERYTAQEIAEIFDGLGGELNAATSREHTVVFARVADHHLETAIDVMSDMVFTPSLGEVDSEREVVLEEIAMYEDQPQELVHDLIAEAVFGDHPLGRPVIGTSEVISTISRRAISAYHRSMYVPGNVVVAAAGNLDHNELLRLLERAEQKVQQPPARGRVRSPLVKASPPNLRFTRKDTEQYHVCVGAPGIARSDRRRFAASLLDAILGGSASSRLFQEIREKRGMAYAVYSFASQYTDTGQIGFYVGTREENLGDCLAIAAEQIAEVAAGNLKPDELERAKENLKGRILLSMESTSNRMSRLGKSLITDTEILSMDRIIAEIDAVEPEALGELAALLLAPERLSAAGIGPTEERFLAAVERVSPALTAAAA
jgi:predicted Zn-dependent peptidase